MGCCQIYFTITGPPQQKIMNPIVERCLNISRYVTSFVLIYTCEPQYVSNKPVSLFCEVGSGVEALMWASLLLGKRWWIYAWGSVVEAE